MSQNGVPWKTADEKLLRVLSAQGRFLDDMMAQIHRPKRSIIFKLREMGLPVPGVAGVQRKCINWDSWERPCKNTFVGRYAGPCPRCRNIPGATTFELPARLL